MSLRFIRFLRWFSALLAIALMVGAALQSYQAFFVLERFGLMAILAALALWLAATMLWWLVAEAHIPVTRARIRHILVGAITVGALGLAASIILSRRFISGIEMGLVFEAPLGFIFGGTLGAFYSLLRLRGTRAV
jgi:hypothetical protein